MWTLFVLMFMSFAAFAQSKVTDSAPKQTIEVADTQSPLWQGGIGDVPDGNSRCANGKAPAVMGTADGGPNWHVYDQFNLDRQRAAATLADDSDGTWYIASGTTIQNAAAVYCVDPPRLPAPPVAAPMAPAVSGKIKIPVRYGIQLTAVPGYWAVPEGVVASRPMGGMTPAWDAGGGPFIGVGGTNGGQFYWQVTGIAATGPAQNLLLGGDLCLGAAISERVIVCASVGGFNRATFMSGAEAQAIANAITAGPQLIWDISKNGVVGVVITPRVAGVMGQSAAGEKFTGLEPGVQVSVRVGNAN